MTEPQNLIALKRANEIRFRRSELRASAKYDWTAAAEVIADPPEWVLSMKCELLLTSINRVGQHRATQIMRAAGVSDAAIPTRRIGDLTPRQRAVIVTELEAKKLAAGGRWEPGKAVA